MSKSAREIAEDEMRKYIQEHIEHFSKMEQTNVLFGNTPGAWQCETYLEICRLALKALEPQVVDEDDAQAAFFAARGVTREQQLCNHDWRGQGSDGKYYDWCGKCQKCGVLEGDSDLGGDIDFFVEGFLAAASRNVVARMPTLDEVRKEIFVGSVEDFNKLPLHDGPKKAAFIGRANGKSIEEKFILVATVYDFILSRLGDAKRGG